MKKVFFSLFFSFLLVSGFSQISVGPKAGANYAYFPSIEDGVALNFVTQPILAYHIGVISEFSLSDRFALTAELLYSEKGSIIEQPIFGSSTFLTSYLSIPIAAKLKLGKLGFIAGFEPSILMNERVRFNNNPWGPANDLSNDFDFSLIGGVDFKLNKLYFTVRYIHGLANALELNFTDQNGQPLSNGVNQNRVIQASVGYFFLDKA